MTEIKLTKRYPNSRTEDITDAYMRGWNDALDAVQNGKFHIADTPQTDCDKCIWNVCNYNKVDWDADAPQTDLLVTEYPQDGEVNLIGRDKTEAVVMAYDIYKEMTEPQIDIHDLTDCDFCKDRNCKDCEGGKDEPQTDCGWK